MNGLLSGEGLVGLILIGLTSLTVLLLKIDWTPGKYKVMFHDGPKVGIKTKMSSGWLVVEDRQMKITGSKELSLALENMRSVELFRLHGLGRMIRITHAHGTLFVSVVRFCIAGQIATIDFFKTRKLVALLTASCPSQS